jgi:hypothetical protein
MKTIRQIADEIGVSKQAVQKRIAREPLKTCIQEHTFIKDGIKYIVEDGYNHILQAFEKSMYTRVHRDVDIDASIDEKSAVYSEMVDILKQQVEDLKADKVALQGKNDELHAELAAERQYSREQIATLTAALVSEQALHAGTIQKQLGGGQSSTDEAGAPTVDVAAVAEVEAPADELEAEKTELAKPLVEPINKTVKPGIFGKLFGRKK